MEYTITKKETKKVDLSGETMAAIMVFGKLLKVEKRAEKLADELEKWVLHIPKAEFESYYEITEEMKNK